MAKLTKFQDFKNKEEEKELQDLKRTYTKNTVDTQQFPRNTKYNFNYITRKMDDLSVDEVEDKIDKLEELEESKLNESSVDYDLLDKIVKLPCYSKLREDLRVVIDEFTRCVSDSSEETGYDEGDSDHDMAFNSAVQQAIDEIIGW